MHPRPRGHSHQEKGHQSTKIKDQAGEMSSTNTCTKEAVVPSDLFPHVYAFLVECNLTKAAKSLKKECKIVSPGPIDQAWLWRNFNK